ncbi:acid sphingomyelinase-like phosphodiesterase 3a [Conger conger]|uniref:acid sphingomyelinase-like phosphodiesterase 3a n=1 Tax=Conger conger TaxID=82655 RepID=UPI002A5A9990|nr:acid sphingomyelinase-like phosphodiesterase 3a [Conger conger]
MALQLVLYLLGLLGSLLVSTAPIENWQQSIQVPGSGRFWHISDLHLDPTYHITEDRTKVCFSSQGSPALNPGLFGDYLCDSPYELIQSAFRFMREEDPNPDFMIWTGDSPPHVPAEKLSTDLVIRIISNMTHTIREFFPDLPVYPALGNHDYWPQDQLPIATNEIYQAVAKLWEPWLQPESLTTLRKGGFYSQVIRPNLRLVSLNTNLYYSPNKVTVNMTDPAGQFEWLVDTLDTCRQSDEKAYIIAHVPIGYLPYALETTAMREVYNERLVEIFRKYSDVVAGHFYGHTHRDSIMVLLDHEGQPVNSLFVTPAVTPFRHESEPSSNNPGLRMYYYNPHDYSLLDIWQYYMNLTEANLEKKPDWKLEYIMTKDFNIVDIQPKSLYGLAESFRAPQSETFKKYFNHFMVRYNDSIVCKGICKMEQVCSALSLDHESYLHCILKWN